MAWQCPACKDYVENGRVACTGCGTTRGGVARVTAPAERTERAAPGPDSPRDLAMEGHLAATAMWYRVGGLLGGGLLVLGWLLGRAQGHGASLRDLLVGGGVCTLLFLLGSRLGRLSSGARLVAGVLTLLGLGGTVVGIFRGHQGTLWSALLSLAWSAAYLWLFFSPRARHVTSDGYRRLVDLTVKPRVWASPFFWLPILAFGLTVVTILWFLSVAVLAG